MGVFDLGWTARVSVGYPPTQPDSDRYRHGNFIDLSADGNTVAVGSNEDGSDDGDIPGQISVFRWNPTMDDWEALGTPIIGTAVTRDIVV